LASSSPESLCFTKMLLALRLHVAKNGTLTRSWQWDRTVVGNKAFLFVMRIQEYILIEISGRRRHAQDVSCCRNSETSWMGTIAFFSNKGIRATWYSERKIVVCKLKTVAFHIWKCDVRTHLYGIDIDWVKIEIKTQILLWIIQLSWKDEETQRMKRKKSSKQNGPGYGTLSILSQGCSDHHVSSLNAFLLLRFDRLRHSPRKHQYVLVCFEHSYKPIFSLEIKSSVEVGLAPSHEAHQLFRLRLSSRWHLLRRALVIYSSRFLFHARRFQPPQRRTSTHPL